MRVIHLIHEKMTTISGSSLFNLCSVPDVKGAGALLLSTHLEFEWPIAEGGRLGVATGTGGGAGAGGGDGSTSAASTIFLCSENCRGACQTNCRMSVPPATDHTPLGAGFVVANRELVSSTL